jgi:hypothetical protein
MLILIQSLENISVPNIQILIGAIVILGGLGQIT